MGLAISDLAEKMKTIHKFQLELTDTQEIKMPVGAKVLCVQVQAGVPCIWAEVNTSSPMEMRSFSIYGTGHELRTMDHEYIGTFQNGRLVFHVYENNL